MQAEEGGARGGREGGDGEVEWVGARAGID